MDILDLANAGYLNRIFRARNKIAFPGAICHITQRAVGSEPLFLEEGDYLYMLHLIKIKSKEFNFKVFAFALMPNHIHLLIQIFSENLSEPMKNIFELYAMYFNNKYERKGHLFCGAYRCAICLDNVYLLSSSLYIHLNPVKARIIEIASEYRWSSCNLYLNPIPKKTFLDYKFILEILDDDIEIGQNYYRSLLEVAQNGNINNVLEDPEAVEAFKNVFLKEAVKKFQGTKLKAKLQKSQIFIDENLEKAIIELKKKGKLRKPVDIVARSFLIKQLKARGFSTHEIVNKLGISRYSLYRTLNATN